MHLMLFSRHLYVMWMVKCQRRVWMLCKQIERNAFLTKSFNRILTSYNSILADHSNAVCKRLIQNCTTHHIYIKMNNCISDIHKLLITTVYDFNFSAIVDIPPNLFKILSIIGICQFVNMFEECKILGLELWKCMGHLPPHFIFRSFPIEIPVTINNLF